MYLHLMRHGIAHERQEWSGDDDSRPLTEEGIERTRAVAKALHKDGRLDLAEVWTSPLVRARQTAEIVAKILKVSLKECAAMAPGASVAGLAKFFAKNRPPERFMLVGHEPDIGALLGELRRSKEALSFKRAAVAHCSGNFRPGGMKLKWYLTPKDVLED
jgi:phosphohistidine phosphatase